MIDPTEPLSLVIWAVFALSAGMYPLGFMLGSCSPCCGGGDECTACFEDYFEFQRCARFEAVVKEERAGCHVSGNATFVESSQATVSPVHGFSRSISRPEDVGAKRVVGTADIYITGTRVLGASYSQSLALVLPVTVNLYAYLNPTVNATYELIYTWTLVIDNSVTQRTITSVNNRNSTVAYPPSAADAIYQDGITFDDAMFATVPRPEGTVDYGWNEWHEYLFVAGSKPTQGGVSKVCVKTHDWVLRVSDIEKVRNWFQNRPNEFKYGSPTWITDQARVMAFLNGESSESFTDTQGDEWDVTIQGQTPLCGMSLGSSGNEEIPFSVTATLPGACDGTTFKYDMYGCRFGGVKMRWRIGIGPNAGFTWSSPVRQTYNEFLAPGQPSCYWTMVSQSCNGYRRREISSSAFYCGDLLWSLENGPCNTNHFVHTSDGKLETYELNVDGTTKGDDPGGRKMCEGETIYWIYGQRRPYDYWAIDTGWCWPAEIEIDFGDVQQPVAFTQWSVLNRTYSPYQQCNLWATKESLETLSMPLVGYLGGVGCNSAMYYWERQSVESWPDGFGGSGGVAYPGIAGYFCSNKGVVRTGNTRVVRDCDGNFTIDKQQSTTIDRWLPYPNPTENSFRQAGDTFPCQALVDDALSEGGAGGDGPYDIYYAEFKKPDSVSVPNEGDPPTEFVITSSNSADVIPASGGTITIETDGTRPKQTSAAIPPNLSRFPREIYVVPEYIRRYWIQDLLTITGTVFQSWWPLYDVSQSGPQNTEAVVFTQLGYGGEDDTNCIVNMIWLNAVEVHLAGPATVGGEIEGGGYVVGDFRKETCLVCQPTTVEGTACEWDATSSQDWAALTIEDGLLKLEIDNTVDYEVVDFRGLRALFTEVTFTNAKGSLEWQVWVILP